MRLGCYDIQLKLRIQKYKPLENRNMIKTFFNQFFNKGYLIK